ncbi:MAG: DUF2461 domain-containing protein [Candidatus Limivicinus sp.]|jgi:uncharacterized protein (TIGR02453 family)
MFEGFSPETASFLWELKFNNERPWFLEHKGEFEKYVNTPFKALAQDTFVLVEEKYPRLDGRLHVSRIYRDARRLFGRGPYKDHMWFSIKKDASLMEGPALWFEIGAADYGCGFGFYCASPAQMAAFRAAVDANPAEFEALARRVERYRDFRITGEEYKRSKGDRGELINRWYNRKHVGVEIRRDFGEELYSPELPEKLLKVFEKLMPVYEYFLRFSGGAE